VSEANDPYSRAPREASIQPRDSVRAAGGIAGLKTAIALTLLSGCFWATTKSEGESLRKDVTKLQDQMASKQKTLDDQIAQLQKVLDDSSKLLKRNSADLGADVEALRSEVRAANGLATQAAASANELRTTFDAYRKANDARLDSIEQRLGQIESGKPSANSSPEDLWKLGSQAFEAQRYNDAAEIFRRLSTSFPTHDRADDAVYFRGQAFTNMKDWEKAINDYRVLLDKYATSPLTDDGLYFAAQAAQNLKQCTEARTYLNLLKTKYPKSNVLKAGADLDAAIKKSLKDKSKCSS
jgi:TolA-binding protein